MEQKINNLVEFAVSLGRPNNLIDYYALLSNYCCTHVYDSITNDFNDVIGIRGGVTLFYLKLQIYLVEHALIANPQFHGDDELKLLQERFQERYNEYVDNGPKK